MRPERPPAIPQIRNRSPPLFDSVCLGELAEFVLEQKRYGMFLLAAKGVHGYWFFNLFVVKSGFAFDINLLPVYHS